VSGRTWRNTGIILQLVVMTTVCSDIKDSHICDFYCAIVAVVGWLGSQVVSMLDSGAEGPGFKAQPRCCQVTVLRKLFTPIVPLFTKHKIGSSLLKPTHTPV